MKQKTENIGKNYDTKSVKQPLKKDFSQIKGAGVGRKIFF